MLAPVTVKLELKPTQMAVGVAVMLKVGNGFIFTVMVVVPTQPFEFVPLMLYVVVAVGLAVTLVAVALLNPVEGDHV